MLGKKTLRELQSLSPDESTPVDPTVVNHARQTYVLIRAAWHGMGLLQERQQNQSSFQDPVLGLARQRVETAQTLTRTAVDGAGTLSRAEYLSRAISDLSKAMKLLDQAMIMMP